jgi:hypothetical protein
LLGSYCPLPVKNTVVLGDPILYKCKDKTAGPTAEELDKAHADFVERVVKLFEDNKKRLGFGDRVLEVI